MGYVSTLLSILPTVEMLGDFSQFRLVMVKLTLHLLYYLLFIIIEKLVPGGPYISEKIVPGGPF